MTLQIDSSVAVEGSTAGLAELTIVDTAVVHAPVTYRSAPTGAATGRTVPIERAVPVEGRLATDVAVGAAMDGALAQAAPRRSPARRLLIPVLFVAVLTIDAWILKPYLSGAATALSHPHLWWLLVALLAEFVSMSAFARLQSRLLKAGGVRVPIRRVMSLTYSSNALSVSVPGGVAVASAYRFRRMRSWNASAPLATFALIATGVISAVALFLLGLLGAALAGADADGTSPVTIALVVVAAVAAVVVTRRVRRRPEIILNTADRVLHAINRVLRRERTAGEATVHGLVDDVLAIHPRRRDWSLALFFAVLNWAADVVCLIASCRTVGANDTTIGLALVAYAAGMAAASLSIIPGGLGVADAAIIAALAHGSLSVVTATAGVLLYRLISFVLVVLVGWVAWAADWQLARRRTRRVVVDAVPVSV